MRCKLSRVERVIFVSFRTLLGKCMLLRVKMVTMIQYLLVEKLFAVPHCFALGGPKLILFHQSVYFLVSFSFFLSPFLPLPFIFLCCRCYSTLYLRRDTSPSVTNQRRAYIRYTTKSLPCVLNGDFKLMIFEFMRQTHKEKVRQVSFEIRI